MAKKTKKVEIKKAKATISKQNKDGSTEDYQEEVGKERMFEDPPCNVGYSAGMTLPLPTNRYANAKFGVSLHIPCKHDEINQTYEFAKEWVDERMGELVQEVEDD